MLYELLCFRTQKYRVSRSLRRRLKETGEQIENEREKFKRNQEQIERKIPGKLFQAEISLKFKISEGFELKFYPSFELKFKADRSAH